MNELGQTSASTPLQVLFIGNSQFSVWDIPRMVQELSAKGRPLHCEACLVGGAWLHTHLENSATMDRLAKGPWDAVVLQEHYRAPEETGRQKFFAAASTLCDAILKLPAKPVLYASPNIESEGREGFSAIHALNLEFAGKRGLVVAGAGAACLKVWARNPQLDLHDTDRRHPNYHASYIGACVLYAALTGMTPVGLSNRCGKSMVSENEALQFQMAAWDEYRETNAGTRASSCLRSTAC